MIREHLCRQAAEMRFHQDASNAMMEGRQQTKALRRRERARLRTALRKGDPTIAFQPYLRSPQRSKVSLSLWETRSDRLPRRREDVVADQWQIDSQEHAFFELKAGKENNTQDGMVRAMTRPNRSTFEI